MLDFWSFVGERESIRLKRETGLPRPWTSDPVLQSAFINNIFREDDPGTKVAMAIMAVDAPAWERLLNVVLYRRMGREENWHGYLSVDVMLDWAARVEAAPGPNFNSAAYVVPLNDGKQFTGSSLTRVAKSVIAAEPVARRLVDVLPGLSVQKAYAEVAGAGIWNVGPFLSWQIALDLRYGDDPVVTAADDWAPLEAGAARGLTWVSTWPEIPEVRCSSESGNTGKRRAKEGSVAIPQLPQAELYALAAKMVAEQPASDRPLTFAALEHGLCEWSKYVRISNGGRSQRRFR